MSFVLLAVGRTLGVCHKVLIEKASGKPIKKRVDDRVIVLMFMGQSWHAAPFMPYGLTIIHAQFYAQYWTQAQNLWNLGSADF